MQHRVEFEAQGLKARAEDSTWPGWQKSPLPPETAELNFLQYSGWSAPTRCVHVKTISAVQGPSEGARRRVDVMTKDGNRYASSGGWRFERFMGSDETGDIVRESGATMCFACHARAKNHGFVFSRIR